MWPLFTERWGPWRQERLGLSPLPLAGALERRGALPWGPPLLYGKQAGGEGHYRI